MIELNVIGVVRSALKSLDEAPRQGDEGGAEAWLELEARYAPALEGLSVGDDVFVFTWLDRGRRDVLQTRPRNDASRAMTGVFATRSPDRPNPIGLHRVKVLALDGAKVRVAPLEAIDGTPVVDVKPVLSSSAER